MTRTRSRFIAGLMSLAVLSACSSCDGLGSLGLFGLFGSGVQITIENNTSYTAVPEIRTSDSDNLFEDIFNKGDLVTSFGTNGAIAPRQTVTFYLQCDGDLELIAFGGADFREGNGLGVGDADSNTKLRRDSDFDCGAVIRIRLEGGIFNFSADVDVTDYGQDSSGSDSSRSSGSSSSADSLADMLEDLFD